MEEKENLTLVQLFSEAIKLSSHDKNYVIPGIYDVNLVDSVWILSTTLLFFTIQTGLAFIEMGIVESKNYTNVLMKHFVDMCCGGFAFWIWGFGLMHGRGQYSNGFFGFGDFVVNTETNDPLSGQVLSFFFFQMAFCSTASTIFSGAVTGRVKFKAYIFLSMAIVTIYSIGAGWIWGEHGFLRRIGVVDFAGTTPIHVLSGTCCLVAVLYLGPRKGRFDIRSSNSPPLSSPVYTCIGTFILWWGWVAFNAGSSYGVSDGKFALAARAGTGTMISSMCGGFTGIIGSMVRNKGKAAVIDVVGCILSSLVAINAGCSMFSIPISGFVGFVAAIIYLFSSRLIYKMKIDDTTDATVIHLICGIWGNLSVGLFADPPSGPKSLFLDGSFFYLKVQSISVLCIILWAGTAIYLFMFLLNLIYKIRPMESDELLGSDKTEHEIDEDAYLLDSPLPELAYSENSETARYRKNFQIQNFNSYHPETPNRTNGGMRNDKRKSYDVTNPTQKSSRFHSNEN